MSFQGDGIYCRRPIQLLPLRAKEGAHYNRDQWETLLSIADTIIPSIKISRSVSTSSHYSVSPERAAKFDDDIKYIVSDYPDSHILKDYFEENASAVSLDLLKRVVGEYLHEDTRNRIGFLMKLLR